MSNSVRHHRRQPTRLPVPGILQARTLEWVAISFSNAWKWKVKVKSLSHVWLFATPWTARLPHPWDFPGKSTGVGCHCLLRNCIIGLYKDWDNVMTIIIINMSAQWRNISRILSMGTINLMLQLIFFLDINWLLYK